MTRNHSKLRGRPANQCESREGNSPQVWDGVWETHTSQPDIEETVRSLRWQRIAALVVRYIGKDLSELRTIELGAGAATYSRVMASLGADVTVVDYSPKALALARTRFADEGLAGNFVSADVLSMSDELKGQFDLSWSFGLAEHFESDERARVLQTHLDVVRPGGMSVISVPNRFNPPYRIWKWVLEKRGRWNLGVEIPYSRGELCGFCTNSGNVAKYGFTGDSFLESLHFLSLVSPYHYLLRRILKPSTVKRRQTWRLPGTPLDAFCSYSLVLWMVRRDPGGPLF